MTEYKVYNGHWGSTEQRTSLSWNTSNGHVTATGHSIHPV